MSLQAKHQQTSQIKRFRNGRRVTKGVHCLQVAVQFPWVTVVLKVSLDERVHSSTIMARKTPSGENSTVAGKVADEDKVADVTKRRFQRAIRKS